MWIALLLGLQFGRRQHPPSRSRRCGGGTRPKPKAMFSATGDAGTGRNPGRPCRCCGASGGRLRASSASRPAGEVDSACAGLDESRERAQDGVLPQPDAPSRQPIAPRASCIDSPSTVGCAAPGYDTLSRSTERCETSPDSRSPACEATTAPSVTASRLASASTFASASFGTVTFASIAFALADLPQMYRMSAE